MDSAICNKLYRVTWLECIAKDFGSVSTLIQPFLTNDKPIHWCSKRNVQLRSLRLDFTLNKCKISINGAALLAMCCCINLTDFQLIEKRNSAFKTKHIITALSKQCFKLKRLSIHSPNITNTDIKLLLSRNHDLEEIKLSNCHKLRDICLKTIAANCHRLEKVNCWFMQGITDKGVSALVSTHPGMKDIQLAHCTLLTDKSLTAIAANCHKLLKITFANTKLVTDDAFIPLVSNNHDLVEVCMATGKAQTGSGLTDASMRAIAASCHKLQKISFSSMNDITDNGVAALVSNNHELKEIKLEDCPSLTDTSLITIANNVKTMERVILSSLQITDRGLVPLVSNNRGLEGIHVIHGHGTLTDASLQAIAINCHKLRRISFSNMNNITDTGISAVVSNNRDLESVFLANCTSLTDTSYAALADNCPHLNFLNCRGSNMTSAGRSYVYSKLFPAILILN